MAENNQRTTLYILVPAYNEQNTICQLLKKVIAVDLSRFDLALRVVVIDDGSQDATWEKIEAFINNNPDAPITSRRLKDNQGKGHAIRKALTLCENDEGIVIIQDADLEYNPNQYPRLIRPILSGNAGVVFGSRWMPPGPTTRPGGFYALGGWLVNQYVKILYRENISDVGTCYKAMPVKLMKGLNLECNGFEFCPEVTAKLLNRDITIAEVPIDYRARKKSEGKKIRWHDFFPAIYTLTKVWLLKK